MFLPALTSIICKDYTQNNQLQLATLFSLGNLMKRDTEQVMMYFYPNYPNLKIEIWHTLSHTSQVEHNDNIYMKTELLHALYVTCYLKNHYTKILSYLFFFYCFLSVS
jgi:hypothetical protein